MNKHNFLNSTNVEILWEVIIEQNIFKNRNAFETVLTEFYESENSKHSDLVMLNKAFISSILSVKINQESKYKAQEKIPITFEELQNEKLSQFELKLTEQEDDFKQLMARPMPQQIPNFRDKMDEPLTEIEKIMKRTIAERNYDIAQIGNANDAKMQVDGKPELKSQETSIKKEKLSPLFFSKNNSEIKYIKIDKNTMKETPVPIDLDKPEKHISWDQEIKRDYFYNEPEPVEPISQNKRVEQMKKIHTDALEVFRKKNTDYGDSFATYGIIGILIRIEDKMRSAISISKNGVTLVKDEGIRDTLLDLHNYAAMGLMLLDEE